MTEEIAKLLEKAEHALEVAGALQKDGYQSDAASKTYYAMYYAAQALLKSEGINVIRHSAVESFFGRHFVKTGKIESKFHKILINARKIREIADYDIQEEIAESTASTKLGEGRLFVKTIKEIIN